MPGTAEAWPPRAGLGPPAAARLGEPCLVARVDGALLRVPADARTGRERPRGPETEDATGAGGARARLETLGVPATPRRPLSLGAGAGDLQEARRRRQLVFYCRRATQLRWDLRETRFKFARPAGC